MNKGLVMLLLVVFMAVGALLFFSTDEAPVTTESTQQSSPEDDAALPPLTEADRDTYANTIKTMNARNNQLLQRLDEMDQRLKAKEKQAIDEQDVEQIVNQRVEERARNLTSTFSQKYNQIRGEFSQRLKSQASKIPGGLGFDGPERIKLPLGGSKPKRATSQPLGSKIVTILPVTTVGTIGEREPVPVAIDGTPLEDPLQARTGLMREQQQQKPTRAPLTPVYTIPQNATLFSNDTLTALVGIVPNLQGSVVDPIRFKVITGGANLASNGLFLPPGVRDIVWSGIAIGNREMSCVRGELHSVTFTFEDGTIRTVNAQADKGKNKLGGNLLGYISTQKGNPCLPGTLITNAQDYLTDRMLASGVAAAAEGFSDTQTTTQQATDGTLTQFFSGNSGDYIASKTLSGSFSELTDYLRERQAQAIDLVYTDAGQDVVLHVETQIDIDYDPEGRRLDHGHQVKTDRFSYQLD